MTSSLDVTSLGSADAMEAMLRRIGAERYHILHPFHRLLHGGRLSRGQVQAWALNRYYYQSRIPMKDAALISRCADRELRREWLVRILDHDGFGQQEGGIARWSLHAQLRCLLLASTAFVTVPDPIAEVEAAVARGFEPWLLVIQGDEAPSGRPGWEQLVSNPRFSTWRFKKAS